MGFSFKVALVRVLGVKHASISINAIDLSTVSLVFLYLI